MMSDGVSFVGYCGHMIKNNGIRQSAESKLPNRTILMSLCIEYVSLEATIPDANTATTPKVGVITPKMNKHSLHLGFAERK